MILKRKWLNFLRISILLIILLALKKNRKKKSIQNDNSDYGFFVDLEET